MYNVPYFKADNQQEVLDFMHAHPFIMLIANGKDYPAATQVPIIIEERDDKMILRGHIMRKTDHHKALELNPNVLVVFSGEHTYISASWYMNKQTASTWNYRAVHAQGVLRFTDKTDLVDLLTKLTATFENNHNSPSLVEHLSAEYLEPMLKAILSFKIEITNIEHVFKLSQNRDPESYQNIVAHLNKGNADAIAMAEVMKKKNRNL